MKIIRPAAAASIATEAGEAAGSDSPARRARAGAAALAARWPHAGSASVTPMKSGWSGMTALRVDTPTASHHLKIALDAPLPAEQVAREVRNARFAAAIGIGPEVMWADLEAQALMTRLVVDVSDAHRDGGPLDAVVAATLAVLARLHAAPYVIDRRERTAAGGEALAKLDAALARAAAAPAGGPMELASLRPYAARLVARLVAMPYVESLCHGDMNGCNSIFDGSRAWIIDWTYLKLGDGLYELAYYGFHVRCGMPDTEALLASYSAEAAAAPGALQRLRLHLALLHVHRYAMRVTGMPWHDPGKRGAELCTMANHLAADARQLGLAPPALAPAQARLAVRQG